MKTKTKVRTTRYTGFGEIIFNGLKYTWDYKITKSTKDKRFHDRNNKIWIHTGKNDFLYAEIKVLGKNIGENESPMSVEDRIVETVKLFLEDDS